MEEFRKQGSWFSYNIELFRDWLAFLRVFIPIGMMTFTEFSFWEIQTFIVGTQYGTLQVFLFYIPLSLSFTINSYLGKMVGAG